MPLVRIDAIGADSSRLEALGRAVHDALTETIGFPPDDRFHILVGHDGAGSMLRYGNYPDIERDEGVVYVSLTMRSGRTPEQKRALYARIAELGLEYSGTEPRNMMIVLTENSSIDWSFGHGIAQYSPL